MKKSAVVAALDLIVVVTAALLPVAVATRPSKYTQQEDANIKLVNGVGSFAVTMYKLSLGRTMSYVNTSQRWSVPSNGGYEYWSELTAKESAGGYHRYVATVWGIPTSESMNWKLFSFNSTN